MHQALPEIHYKYFVILFIFLTKETKHQDSCILMMHTVAKGTLGMKTLF